MFDEMPQRTCCRGVAEVAELLPKTPENSWSRPTHARALPRMAELCPGMIEDGRGVARVWPGSLVQAFYRTPGVRVLFLFYFFI